MKILQKFCKNFLQHPPNPPKKEKEEKEKEEKEKKEEREEKERREREKEEKRKENRGNGTQIYLALSTIGLGGRGAAAASLTL